MDRTLNLGDVGLEYNNVLGNDLYHDNGGGVVNLGSAILNVINSTFLGNTACNGGGISSDAAYLSVRDSTFELNDADFSRGSSCGDGGGINTRNDSWQFEIDNVLFQNNQALRGGGVFFHGSLSSAEGSISDSTFRQNYTYTGSN